MRESMGFRASGVILTQGREVVTHFFDRTRKKTRIAADRLKNGWGKRVQVAFSVLLSASIVSAPKTIVFNRVGTGQDKLTILVLA